MSDAPGWVTLTEGEAVVLDRRPSVVPYLTGLAWPSCSRGSAPGRSPSG